jgi:hypothetical protein
MKQYVWISVMCVVMAAALLWAEEEKNLVANPSFEEVKDAEVGEARKVPAQWRFYVIALDALDSADTAEKHEGATSFQMALNEKGKGFLHSAAFDVTAGTTYQVSAWIKGQGALAFEVLWWVSYPEPIQMCEHHRDFQEQPTDATAEWKEVKAPFTAPEGATKAYLRLVGTKGNLWIDDVKVVAQ